MYNAPKKAMKKYITLRWSAAQAADQGNWAAVAMAAQAWVDYLRREWGGVEPDWRGVDPLTMLQAVAETMGLAINVSVSKKTTD